MKLSRLERALSTFTARSSDRDAKIDKDRMLLLTETLNGLTEAVVGEKRGIVERVKRVLEDPNPASANWTLGRRPGVSKAEFIVLENRLQVLDKQLLAFEEIRRIVSEIEAMRSPKS